MEAKTVTIFTYSPLHPSSTNSQNDLSYKYLFHKWLKPKPQRITGDKGGIANKNLQIAKTNIQLTPLEPQELIPIQESKNINIHITPIAQEKQLIEKLKKKANRLVLTVSSKFPFDPFPTKMHIQESRVSVVFNDFLSTQVHSMDIKDISNVFIESAFLFANLTLITRTFIENDVKVNKLKKSDAIYARRIIEGLRMLASENIDTSKYEIPDLIQKLEDLSQYHKEV
jgi:hypothetical protein